MKITIDNREITVLEGETILEAATRAGISIPSMCYAKDKKHKEGCMVCIVKDLASGQMVPSCVTPAKEGMQIDSTSEAVLQHRRIALELLLSDHRADCEAPCTLVCPHGLDVEQFLAAYDNGAFEQARAILKRAFSSLPTIACDECKAPCEKACRRGSVDKSVAIRDIIREVAAMESLSEVEAAPSKAKIGKDEFFSRVGIFSENEKERLRKSYNTSSRCMHCACDGRVDCRLRAYAKELGIKRSQYGLSTKQSVKLTIEVNEHLRFEPAKCIRCGLCVYNTDNGFTFIGRGFDMKVVIPEENKHNAYDELAQICPTGAIYLK